MGLLRDLFPVLRRMTMCSGARLALLVYGILMHSSVYGSPAASGLRFPGIRGASRPSGAEAGTCRPPPTPPRGRPPAVPRSGYCRLPMRPHCAATSLGPVAFHLGDLGRTPPGLGAPPPARHSPGVPGGASAPRTCRRNLPSPSPSPGAGPGFLARLPRTLAPAARLGG